MSQVHHSDVIGSLLRPKYLTDARDAYAAGQLSAPEFKRIEDRAVDQAIAMQEGIGLDVVTDGEFRRFSFLDQVVGEINGVEPIEGAPVHFKNATEDWVWHNPFTVTGKISQKRKITLEEFAYNRARATKQIKITFPSPLLFYSGWSPELSTAAYKDAYELFADAAAIIRAEMRGPRRARLHLHPDRRAGHRHASSTRRTASCARTWACPPSGRSPRAWTSSTASATSPASRSACTSARATT